MLQYDDLQLVGTIFHELAHQLVYVRGDSEFNEAFAMSVEREGVARWLASQARSGELAAYRMRLDQQAQILNILAAGRARVATLYREAPPLAQRRGRQQGLPAAAHAAPRGHHQQRGPAKRPADWAE